MRWWGGVTSDPGYWLTIALSLPLLTALPKVPQAWLCFLSNHLIPCVSLLPIVTFYQGPHWARVLIRAPLRDTIKEGSSCNTRELIESHNLTMCRKWQILEYSVLNKMPLSNTFPHSRGGRKVVRAKENGPRKQHLRDITGLMHLRIQGLRPHAQGHIGLSHMGSQCWEREVGMGPPHL